MALETRNQVDAAEVCVRLGRIEGKLSQANASLDRIEAGQTRLLFWIIVLFGITMASALSNIASVWIRNLVG